VFFTVCVLLAACILVVFIERGNATVGCRWSLPVYHWL